MTLKCICKSLNLHHSIYKMTKSRRQITFFSAIVFKVILLILDCIYLNRTVDITLITNRKLFILIMNLTVRYGDLTFSFVVVIYGQPILSYFSRLNDTFNASSITILHHGLSTCHINKCGKINVKRVQKLKMVSLFYRLFPSPVSNTGYPS